MTHPSTLADARHASHISPPPFPDAAPADRVAPPPLPCAPTDGRERRRARRVPATVEVTYTSRHNFFAGRTRNISEGGLFLESRDDLDVGDRVCVNLHLMNRSFAIRCEVMWLFSDERGAAVGLGLRFVALEERARRAIESFMALRSPLEFFVT